MNKKVSRFWPLLLFLLVYIGIFYKVFFFSLWPYPSDLLVSWFFPYNSGGWEGYSPWITHKEFIAADVVRQLYPWRVLAMEILKEGQLPLWNPYSFSGTPLLANAQSSVFYPLNILFFVFDSKVAWNVYILLQPILAFFFMYIFIRALGLSKWSGLFSGLAFGFIGYMRIWFELGVVGHSALWLPLVLWSITKYVATQDYRFLFATSLGIAFSIFAGHAQTSAYLLLVSVAYYIFIVVRKLYVKQVLLFLSFVGLGCAIAAIQIFPSIEFMSLSARDVMQSNTVFHRFQLPIQHVITFIAPDFFGNPATLNFWGIDYGEFLGHIGIAIFTFSLIGLFQFRQNSLVKFFALSIIVSLLFAIPTPLSEALLAYHVPVLGTGIPSRTLFVVQFSLLVLGAFGIEQFLSAKNKNFLKPLVLLFLCYAVLWLFVFIASKIDGSLLINLQIAKRNLVLPTAVFIVTTIGLILGIRKISIKPLVLCLLLATAAFEYQNALYKFLPFAPLSYIFPSHPLVSFLKDNTSPDRVFGYDTARLETNLSVQWRVLSPEGYDPLYPRRYGELILATQKEHLDRNIPRSDALFVNSLPNEDSYPKQTVMNLLGVKYAVDKDDNPTFPWQAQPWRFPQERYKFIWQQQKWKVYENKNALPRAAFFTDYEVISEDNKIIDRLFSKEFPYREKLITESDSQIFSHPKITTEAEEVAIKKYTALDIELALDAKSNGFVFLSDTYYPGWKAYVDGKETKIYRANYAFRAVYVSPGNHTISFLYKPESFFWGMWITMVSLAILLVAFLFSFQKRITSVFKKTLHHD